jgi:hypothetical protein
MKDLLRKSMVRKHQFHFSALVATTTNRNIVRDPEKVYAKLESQSKLIKKLRREKAAAIAKWMNNSDVDGIKLSKYQAKKVQELVETADDHAEKVFKADSIHMAVWKDQLDNIKRIANKGRRSVSYSASTISFALDLLVRLGKYSYIKLSKIFVLPNHRHLRKYKNFAAKDGAGFLSSVVAAMKDKIADICKDFDEDDVRKKTSFLHCLSGDCMEIKKGLQYDAAKGTVVGMEDTDPNSDIVQRMFEVAVAAGADSAPAAAGGATPVPAAAAAAAPKRELASKFIVWFAQSVGIKDCRFPIYRAPLATCNGSTMLAMVDKIVLRLDAAGFAAISQTMDGAGDNRAMANVVSDLPLTSFKKPDPVTKALGPLIGETLEARLAAAGVGCAFMIASYNAVRTDHPKFTI